MTRERDDWPERCGHPLIVGTLQTLGFVADCLTDSPRQAAAKKLVNEARGLLEKAIEALDGA